MVNIIAILIVHEIYLHISIHKTKKTKKNDSPSGDRSRFYSVLMSHSTFILKDCLVEYS